MHIDGWQYYNHAAIPKTAPNEEVNLKPILDGTIFKIDGKKPCFATWSSNWDCGYETQWWYVIKDSPFDISDLKAKRRYEINKGRKNFTVREINPIEYIAELFKITLNAFSQWPERYRPKIEEEKFRKSVLNWKEYTVFGGWDNESNELSGYAVVGFKGKSIEFYMLRVNPESEKKQLMQRWWMGC